jgi:GNAT superfamily N-acetyltransferase
MDVMEQARVEDAQDIAELYLLARRESLGAIPPVFGSEERVLTWLGNRIRNGEECWITRDESGISAFMLLEPGWLDQFYVRPDRIGQGLGARLVDKAKLLMPNGMRLWTFQSNVRAHKFYEHHGFVVLERTDGRHNEEQSPDVCYEWKPTAT